MELNFLKSEFYAESESEIRLNLAPVVKKLQAKIDINALLLDLIYFPAVT